MLSRTNAHEARTNTTNARYHVRAIDAGRMYGILNDMFSINGKLCRSLRWNIGSRPFAEKVRTAQTKPKVPCETQNSPVALASGGPFSVTAAWDPLHLDCDWLRNRISSCVADGVWRTFAFAWLWTQRLVDRARSRVPCNRDLNLGKRVTEMVNFGLDVLLGPAFRIASQAFCTRSSERK